MNNSDNHRPYHHTATYYRKVKFYMKEQHNVKIHGMYEISPELSSPTRQGLQNQQFYSSMRQCSTKTTEHITPPVENSNCRAAKLPNDSIREDCNIIYDDNDIDNPEIYNEIIGNEFNDTEDQGDDQDLVEEKLPIAMELQNWALRNHISHSAINELLELLPRYGMNNLLPKDARTLLSTPRMVRITKMGSGEFWYNGLRQTLMMCLPVDKQCPEILLNINIDGLPINRSSKNQFWPILASLANIPEILPMIVAIYCGDTKPPSVEDYLRPFVNELNDILLHGIRLNNHIISIKLNCFICDTPARSFLKCVIGFNAYHGCQKCEVEGEYHQKQRHMSYPQVDCPLRTDDSFRNKQTPDHHLKVADKFLISPLEQIHNFDMVQDVIIADDLHLFYLGIMKRLLCSWTRGSTNCQSKFFPTQKTEISQWLIHTNSTKPKEIHRAVRGLDCLPFWKGTEFRTFLLYLGPVVLKDYLTSEMYQNFITLSCAVTICSTKYYLETKKFFLLSKKLLLDFIEQYISLYGIDAVSSNVHNLCHVMNDIERFGPLPNMSSYKFENMLYTIKRFLRHGNRPLSQAAKRLGELSKIAVKAMKPSLPIFKYVTTDIVNTASDVHVQSYKKLELFDGVVLEANGKDEWFLTQNNEIVKMHSAYYSDSKVFIYGSKLKKMSNFFIYPFESRHINIYVSNSDLHEPTTFTDKDIKCKMVYLNYKESNVFLPLLHTLDLFNNLN